MSSGLLSVIIPTCGRASQLLGTLARLVQLSPPPGEILVHVDTGDTETPRMIENQFSGQVTWMQSITTQGPGGGRNLLTRAATSPLLVSLDDDSWPLDPDFIEKAANLMQQRPKAGVLATSVTVAGSEAMLPGNRVFPVSNFENCGCVIRREAFLQTGGFLPLRYAYGMEEADLSLQMLDNGWEILHAEGLRVYHDTGMAHHSSPQVNAAHITNTALLAFLRYPKRFWPLGIAQVANRVRYAVSKRRFRGIANGLMAIPSACWKFRHHQKPVKPETIRKSRELRGKLSS